MPEAAREHIGGDSACRFSLRHYTDTLSAYLDAGYRIVGCDEARRAPRRGRLLVLRHDIDIDPAAVTRMIGAEMHLGVRSTVFVRVRAPGYTAAATADLWRRLAAGGCEIGLHYDSDAPNPTRDVQAQARALTRQIGVMARGASAHRPATTGWTLDPADCGAVGLEYEAYALADTLRLKYISDSRRRWREGCMCRWIGRADRLQVLVHPEWWMPGSLKRKDALLALL